MFKSKVLLNNLLIVLFVGIFGTTQLIFDLLSNTYVGYKIFDVNKEILWDNTKEKFQEKYPESFKIKALYLYNGSFREQSIAIEEQIGQNNIKSILFGKQHSTKKLFSRPDLNGEFNSDYIKLDAMKFERNSNNLITFIYDKSFIGNETTLIKNRGSKVSKAFIFAQAEVILYGLIVFIIGGYLGHLGIFNREWIKKLFT